jgi:hypothetical protein
MSLKNLYAWNGGSQKRFGTGCGLATKSTGCEVPCGLKRPSGCGMIAKSTGCGIVVAPSKR